MARVLWVLWPMAGAYFALCIGIPEIRPFWRNGVRFGPFSSIGFTISFLGSWLVYASVIVGLFTERVFGLIFVVVGLGVAVAMVGGWIEFFEESEDRKRRTSRFHRKDSF